MSATIACLGTSCRAGTIVVSYMHHSYVVDYGFPPLKVCVAISSTVKTNPQRWGLSYQRQYNLPNPMSKYIQE